MESTQKVGDLVMSWRTGDVPLTYLPGEKPGKNPVQFFTDPLLTDPFWPEPTLVVKNQSPSTNFMAWHFVFFSVYGSGKQKAHKHKFFGPVALGTPGECPRDKPGLSPGQSGFVPGTNPGFLLILHSGSPVCPWDKPVCPGDIPGTKGGRQSLRVKRYVPFSYP